VKAFGDAAEILAIAGWMGWKCMVMKVLDRSIHHGFVEQEDDKYGGDLRGRLTFPLEILREISAGSVISSRTVPFWTQALYEAGNARQYPGNVCGGR